MIPGDDCPAEYVRYSTGRAIERICELLGLSTDPFMQDHDVELADSSRVAEFLQAYSDPRLNDDDRFFLMGLVIASLDSLLSQGKSVSLL